MQLEILTFCDAATEYGGRLNILGATDTITAPLVPFKYPNCAVVARLRAARIEEGNHTVRLMIIDADGQPILNVDGRMEIRFHQGKGGAMNMIINAHQLEFKSAGDYAIEIAVDGIQLGSSALFVQLRDHATPPLPTPSKPSPRAADQPPAPSGSAHQGNGQT
jgi:hypothetical protein